MPFDTVMAKLSEPSSNYLLAAVSGGVFAEGIDYFGDRLIGAFAIGPALPAYSAATSGEGSLF